MRFLDHFLPTRLALLATLGFAVTAVTGCSQPEPTHQTPVKEAGRVDDLLYVWAFDTDQLSSDFLAVLDADSGSESYGQILHTVPVGLAGGAHHTEHRFPAGGTFFANAFAAGTTFLFDTANAREPQLRSSFVERKSDDLTVDEPAFTFPHSFERLENGHVLATFQNLGDDNREPGGLVELDEEGAFVRGSRAADPVDPQLRPYSLAILPAIDRVVTTTADMRGQLRATSVQLWRLSDLELLETILLPPGPRGDENVMPAEPRVLSDGQRVVVNTFSCGLYLLTELDSDEPAAIFLRNFPYQPPHRCALAVLAGDVWIQTVPTSEALVSLDLSDPAQPELIQELRMGDDYRPHWISADRRQRRIVATGRGAMDHRVVVVRLDPETGRMELDSQFGEAEQASPGVSFAREEWPHGTTGNATPHGSLFSD